MNAISTVELADEPKHRITSRFDLIPKWVNTYILCSIFLPVILVMAAKLSGPVVSIKMIGLEIRDLLSLNAFLFYIFILFKMFAALGLWREKDWGIRVALVDAFVGLIFQGSYVYFNYVRPSISYNFISFDIILTICYIYFLLRISAKWRTSGKFNE